MIMDPAELQRQLAATWLLALNAVIVVIVALVGHRLALNWTGRAMRRARVDTGTQILVKRAISAAFFTVTLTFTVAPWVTAPGAPTPVMPMSVTGVGGGGGGGGSAPSTRTWK